MSRAARFRKVYYSVFALKDGTIYAVCQGRKPRKTRDSRAPKIDEDGIHTWYLGTPIAPFKMEEWERAAYHSTVSTCLNMKRLLRNRVECRLQNLERRVEELGGQLDRIEAKLDRLEAGQ